MLEPMFAKSNFFFSSLFQRKTAEQIDVDEEKRKTKVMSKRMKRKKRREEKIKRIES